MTPEDVVAEALAGTDEGVVVCGHTHVQFDRSVGARRLVNAGSVGMPYEDEPGAYWTLLGPGLQPMCTPYDLAAAGARIRSSGAPEADALIASLEEPPDKQAMVRRQEARRAEN